MDKVAVIFNKLDNQEGVLGLCPDINLYTGKKEFSAEFGEPTSLEEDLLILGSAIFASDLATKRGQQQRITRNIHLTIPVTNLAVFKNVKDDLEFALHVLSHDAWIFNFIRREGQPEHVGNWGDKDKGKVLLFSGGLDSFAAAVSLAEIGEQVQFVSHVTANQVVSGTQESLFEYLSHSYPKQLTRLPFRVTGIDKLSKGFAFPSDKEREETQRTRSFMFLTLAGLVARRRGIHEVVMIAENGQMAIHLPLSAGRISAFSTHTAHPEFVAMMSKILSSILSYDIQIENPFLYMTKAEVVKQITPKHVDIIDKTVSCWRASRVPSQFHHCGICVPCLVRRIALETNNICLHEYQTDILLTDISKIDPDNDGKRNLVELCEFINAFRVDCSMAKLQEKFPELVTDYFDANKTVDMYRRFANEAMSVFNHYPNVMKLIG
ncbi:MAG: 7-cyano-7-deazaguanine synthase [Smithella sp.]